jgi:hypothetical protein
MSVCRLSGMWQATQAELPRALVAANFVSYKTALTRGAEAPGEVFAGILCRDRCASYLKYHKGEVAVRPETITASVS